MRETDYRYLDRSWSLIAESGKTTFSGKILERLPARAGRSLLLTEIELHGVYWDRADWEMGDRHDDCVEDFHVALPQFFIDETALLSLRQKLAEWLAQPASFSIDLSGTKDQTASLCFDGEGCQVLSRHHPRFSFKGSTASLSHVEIDFGTNESCVRLFCQQLSRALEDLGY